MAEQKRLRVAQPGESAPVPPSYAKLQDAIQHSERDLLVTMRQKLAAEIDGGVPPHTLAPLVRQLRDIAKEISSLDLRDKQEAKESAELSGDVAWDAAAI